MDNNVFQLFPVTRPAPTPPYNAGELLMINAKKLQEQKNALLKLVNSIRA